MVSKFSGLFEDLDMEKGPIILIHPIYFMLRRFIMALIVVVFRNILIWQIFLKTFTVVTAVIINGWVNGFESPEKRRSE